MPGFPRCARVCSAPPANAGWVLFDAIVTLILAILIWSQWPSSALWFIGTLVGISLIFSGISRVTLASAMRRRG